MIKNRVDDPIFELPADGTPLCPSAQFADMRASCPAARLQFQDGHVGHIALSHGLARAVLEHMGFSLRPTRLPSSANGAEKSAYNDLDEDAQEGLRGADLLTLDGGDHARARRVILPKLSVKVVRSLQPQIEQITAGALDRLPEGPEAVEIHHNFSEPISFATHGLLLGFDGYLVDEFRAIFTGATSSQDQFDFARRLLQQKRSNLGDDLLSTLIESDLTAQEKEALTFVLLSSGRDSIAYFISTSILALIRNPTQLQLLRAEPERMAAAVEELIRYGTMFLTLFPRTASEDFELEGYAVAAGETVAVSAVAANRDPQKFENPNELDITRVAAGHVGFGHGIHSCLGQQYARAVLTQVIGSFFERYPAASVEFAEQDQPMLFAHPIATYQAGKIKLFLGGTSGN
jgi:cytochrome P450